MNVPPYGDSLRRFSAHFATLKVTANSPANMKVKVSEGQFFNGSKMIEYLGGTSYTVTPSVMHPKWVLISVTINSEIRISYGNESHTNPDVPPVPTNDYPLALVYLQPSVDKITEDMIFDVRPIFKTPFTNHNELVGINDLNSHTIDSITGLRSTLDSKLDSSQFTNNLDEKADIDGTISNTFTLNKDFTGTPIEDCSFNVNRGNQPSVGIRWNEDLNRWELTNDGQIWSPINPMSGDLLAYTPNDPNDWPVNSIPTHVYPALDTLAYEAKRACPLSYSPLQPISWGQSIPGTVISALDELIQKVGSNNIAEIPDVLTTLYYVDVNRTDSYIEDGSHKKPFKTIQSALDEANIGSTLLLLPGNYSESLLIEKNVIISGIGSQFTSLLGNITIGSNEVTLKDLKVQGNITLNGSYVFLSNFKCDGNILNNGSLYGNNIILNNPSGSNVPLIISNGNVNLVGVRGTCDGDNPNIVVNGGDVKLYSFALIGRQPTEPVIKINGGITNLYSGSITNTTGPLAIVLNNDTPLQTPNGLFSITINNGKIVNCNNSYTVIDGVYGSILSGTNLLFRSSKHIEYVPTNDLNWKNDNIKTVYSGLESLSERLHELELEQNIFA
jgi:hypothetical protein